MSLASVFQNLFGHEIGGETVPDRPSPTLKILEMQREDLAACQAIERIAGGDRRSMPRARFDDCLAMNSLSFAHIALLEGKDGGGELAGFSVCRLAEQGMAVENLVVLPEFRRRGVARGLLAEVERGFRRGILAPQNMRAIIPERNLGAQKFFAACGWRAIAVLRRPWASSADDGVLFVRRVYAQQGAGSREQGARSTPA